MAKYCNNCGVPVKEADRFCSNCGNPLKGSPPSSRHLRQNQPRSLTGYFVLGGILAVILFTVWLVIPSPPNENPGAVTDAVTGELPEGHPPLDGAEGDSPSTPGEMPAFVMQELARLRKAVQENPEDGESRIQLAEMYYQIGRFDEALTYLDEALKIEPENLTALVMAGNACYDSNQLERAISYYSRALAITPDDVNVRTDMGTMLLHSGNVEQAIKEFTAVLQIRSDFIPAFVNLAEAYSTKGDPAKAIETLRTALGKAHTEQEREDIRARISRLEAGS